MRVRTFICFLGKSISNFSKIWSMCEEAHLQLLPDVPLAGWDVALTKKGRNFSFLLNQGFRFCPRIKFRVSLSFVTKLVFNFFFDSFSFVGSLFLRSFFFPLVCDHGAFLMTPLFFSSPFTRLFCFRRFFFAFLLLTQFKFRYFSSRS